MLAKIGNAVEFVAFFTESKLGKAGLTVTVDVYDQAGVKIKTAVAATAIGGGLYKYTLPAADFDTRGNYKAVFKTTTDTVDVQHVPAMWTAVGSVNVDEEVGTGDLDDTLTGLVRMLRLRLNDLDTKKYTTEEMVYCVNLAYRESVVSTCSHKVRLAVTLVESTHTYDITPIFEPIAIYLDGVEITQSELSNMGYDLVAWDATAAGTPLKFMQLTGNSIRVHPTPGAGLNDLIVYGYAKPVVLAAGSDRPIALPDAYCVQNVLDRAEAEACKMRRTTGANAAVYQSLMTSWKEWCLSTKASIRGNK